MAEINKIFSQIVSVVTRFSEKNPYYALGAFLLVVFLLDYFLIMQFQLGALFQLNPKLTTVAEDMRSTRSDIAKIGEYRQQIVSLGAMAKKVNSKIHTRDEIPLVINNVTRLAKRNSIRIEQIMPDSSAPEPIVKDSEGQYYAVPLRIEARGTYHDFGRFINQLENEEVFLTIGNFRMDASPLDSALHVIKLTLNAVVFEAQGQ
jgi:type IV pilus assembly protein PilO